MSSGPSLAGFSLPVVSGLDPNATSAVRDADPLADFFGLLAIDKLETFLRTYHPADVLMPLRQGTKRPIGAHRGGVWTWASYDEWKRRKRGKVRYGGADDREFGDVCVVLKSLCVVDVDSVELNAELVEAFPVLDEAPAEKTARGFHYWFVRPQAADELGYFDRSGSRTKGLDFKSVYPGGTSGIIAVAPSTGKSWIRPVWAYMPFEIPTDLLDAVAKPRPGSRFPTMSVECLDGVVVLATASRTVASSAYFEPFVVGDVAVQEGKPVPAPVDSGPLSDLMDLVDRGKLPDGDRFGAGYVRSVASAADAVGFPLGPLRSALKRENIASVLLALEVAPDEAISTHRERVWEESGCPSTDDPSASEKDPVLLAVPYPIEYKPLPSYFPDSSNVGEYRRASSWELFGPIVAKPFDALVRAAEARRQKVWSIGRRPDDAFAGAVPRAVSDFMLLFPDNVVAAGGFVAGAVLDLALPGADVDLFVHSCDLRFAHRIASCFGRAPGFYGFRQTEKAITATVDGLDGAPVAVQIIKRLHHDRAQVVASFDMSPCKVLARAVSGDTRTWTTRVTRTPRAPGVSGERASAFVVECMPAFVACARTMAFSVDYLEWSTSSTFRILKYASKGFRVYLPGISAAGCGGSSVRGPRPRTSDETTRLDARDVGDAEDLLVARRLILSRRDNDDNETIPLRKAEVEYTCLIMRTGDRSSYEESDEGIQVAGFRYRIPVYEDGGRARHRPRTFVPRRAVSVVRRIASAVWKTMFGFASKTLNPKQRQRQPRTIAARPIADEPPDSETRDESETPTAYIPSCSAWPMCSLGPGSGGDAFTRKRPSNARKIMNDAVRLPMDG